MAAGMSSDADPDRLVDGLRERWAVLETSFKYHAACRHTHPAADALLKGMEERGLTADDIAGVRARVHAAAIDVLGPVSDPRTIHQSKFSMGFVLALIAEKRQRRDRRLHRGGPRRSGTTRLQREGRDGPRRRSRRGLPGALDRVVEIETSGGVRLTAHVEVPKGDPGNTLSRQELEEKARNLAAYGGGASEEEMDRIVARIWSLDEEAADAAMQTFGGYSYDVEYDVERKFRETRLFQVGPISTNLISPTSASTCSDCRGPSEDAAAETASRSSPWNRRSRRPSPPASSPTSAPE